MNEGILSVLESLLKEMKELYHCFFRLMEVLIKNGLITEKDVEFVRNGESE